METLPFMYQRIRRIVGVYEFIRRITCISGHVFNRITALNFVKPDILIHKHPQKQRKNLTKTRLAENIQLGEREIRPP